MLHGTHFDTKRRKRTHAAKRTDDRFSWFAPESRHHQLNRDPIILGPGWRRCQTISNQSQYPASRVNLWGTNYCRPARAVPIKYPRLSHDVMPLNCLSSAWMPVAVATIGLPLASPSPAKKSLVQPPAARTKAMPATQSQALMWAS